jgi:hypothetical protein
MFSIGKSAYFPDPHDLTVTFYYRQGTYPSWQGYSNSDMNRYILEAISTPDGPERQSLYTQIQVLAVSDVPDFTLDQPVGRHFERDWVVDWYFNQVYQGLYFYGMWKWYYQAEAQLNTAQNPPAVSPALAGFNLPVDVNYDGTVNMKDVGMVAKWFGNSSAPWTPGS